MRLPTFTIYHKMMLWGVSALMIVSVSIGLIIIPTQQALTASKNDIQKRYSEQAFAAFKIQELTTAQRKSATIDQTLQQLETVFVSRSNPLAFINRLETLATEQQIALNINLTDGATATKETTTNYSSVILTLTITGQLTNVLAYINALTTEPTYINVTTLNITPATAGTDQVTVNLEALTYWK